MDDKSIAQNVFLMMTDMPQAHIEARSKVLRKFSSNWTKLSAFLKVQDVPLSDLAILWAAEVKGPKREHILRRLTSRIGSRMSLELQKVLEEMEKDHEGA